MYSDCMDNFLIWTRGPKFAPILRSMVKGLPVEVDDDPPRMPRGRSVPCVVPLYRTSEPFLPESIRKELDSWWLAQRSGKQIRPSWDLVVSCKIQGKRGLVLAQGKANEKELAEEEKGKKYNRATNFDAYEHLGNVIEEARAALDAVVAGVGISRDRFYQLSSRVAFAWKLAAIGIPCVLIYLGFLENQAWKTRKKPFLDDACWRSFVVEHCSEVLPPAMFDREIKCGKASMWLLARSLDTGEILF